MADVLIETLSGGPADRYHDDVLAVWSAVFGPVPDAEEWRVSPWDRHRVRAGYRLAVARAGTELLGFAWGYTGERGQYWSDRIAGETGALLDDWIGGHFEFVELAVRPEARGSGLGRRLHDAILDGIPHRRALLETTADPDDPAVRLYSTRGWISLATLGGGRQVMGLERRLSPRRRSRP